MTDMSPRDEWEFSFGVQVGDGHETIPFEDCDELLDLIIDWAESKGYGIGGGYKPFDYPDEDENEDENEDIA